MAPPTNKPEWPNFLTAQWQDEQSRRDFVHRLRGGARSIQAHAAEFLPRFNLEDERDWRTRVRMTIGFDALDQAINAMVGLALGSGISLGDDMHPRLVDLWENVDGEGLHGDMFAQFLLDDAIEGGFAVLVVDMPPQKTGTERTGADDLTARVFWRKAEARDIMPGTRIETVEGVPFLTQLVLRVVEQRSLGAFGSVEVVTYRVWRLVEGGVVFQKWRESDDSVVLDGDEVAIDGVVEIPAVFPTGGAREGSLHAPPPLEGLAWSQLSHTHIESDRRVSEHRCSVAAPVFSGNILNMGTDPTSGEKALTVSPVHGIQMEKDGSAAYLESAGNGLKSLQEHQQDIEKRMAAQSLALLQPDAISSETATAQRMADAQRRSKLWRASRSLEDSLERAFQFSAQFMGLGIKAAGSVSIRRDFAALLGVDILRFLGELAEQTNLSRETLLTLVFQSLDIPGLDVQTEVEKILREQGGILGALGADPPAPEDTTPEEQGAAA